MTVALQAKNGAGLLYADADAGVVEALVSITGVVDDVNDLIMPGAFAKSLATRRPKGVFSHDLQRWVARTEGVEEWLPGDPRLPAMTADGRPWPAEAGALWVKCRFNLATAEGRDAYENVRFFSETGECYWSIGYLVQAGKALKRRDGVRVIRELEVHEYGPVLFGAASWTGTLSLKSLPAAAGLPARGVPTVPPEQLIWSLGTAGVLPVTPAHRPALQVKRKFSDAQRDRAADDGHAMPDGSYPIKDVTDLRNAIQAYGRCPAGERGKLKRLIMRRAFDLKRPDLIPEGWKPAGGKKYATGGVLPDGWRALLLGEQPPLATKSGVPAAADTPADRRSVRQLIRWYEHGEGAARIRWGEPGDFMRCVRIASEHMTEEQAKGFCNLRHQGALGVAPGQEGGRKTMLDTLESKMFPCLPGTYEEHIAEVQKAVQEALLTDTDDTTTGGATGGGYGDPGGPDGDEPRKAPAGNRWVNIDGTWPDRVVATVIDVSGETVDRQSYEVTYELAGDGSVQLGEPTPVELTVSVQPIDQPPGDGSMLEDQAPAEEMPAGDVVPVVDQVEAATKLAGTLLHVPQTKAGRMLSAASAGLISEAVRRLLQVLTAAGVPVAVGDTGDPGAGMGADPAAQDMEGKAAAVISAAELAEAQALVQAARALE